MVARTFIALLPWRTAPHCLLADGYFATKTLTALTEEIRDLHGIGPMFQVRSESHTILTGLLAIHREFTGYVLPGIKCRAHELHIMRLQHHERRAMANACCRVYALRVALKREEAFLENYAPATSVFKTNPDISCNPTVNVHMRSCCESRSTPIGTTSTLRVAFPLLRKRIGHLRNAPDDLDLCSWLEADIAAKRGYSTDFSLTSAGTRTRTKPSQSGWLRARWRPRNLTHSAKRY